MMQDRRYLLQQSAASICQIRKDRDTIQNLRDKLVVYLGQTSVVAMFLFIGCRGTAAVESTGSPSGNAASNVKTHARLKGRVLFDGVPVTHFGVATIRDYLHPITAVPESITTSDGTFSVVVQPGEWDIAIVGPGFARHLIMDVHIDPEREVSIGDIHVKKGFVVDGHVVDEIGDPVSNANVSILQKEGAPLDGSLEGMLVGNLLARTDAAGAFRFEGVSILDLSHGRLRVFATASGAKLSLPKWLGNGSHTVTLVARDTGLLTGSVEHLSSDTIVLIRPSSEPSALIYSEIVDGAYRIELPVGEYNISLFNSPRNVRMKHVKITSGGSVTADFTLRP